MTPQEIAKVKVTALKETYKLLLEMVKGDEEFLRGMIETQLPLPASHLETCDVMKEVRIKCQGVYDKIFDDGT